jgi:hypothetical protein
MSMGCGISHVCARGCAARREGGKMNPFQIELIGGSMTKHAKRKAKARGDNRKVWVTIEGKRMQTTARGARILRLARGALKGISPN